MPHRDPIVYHTLDEVPAFVIAKGSMLWNKTGSWRYLRPVYRQMTPPCNNGCPAGNNVEGFIKLAREKNYAAALNLIKQENPLSAVCGRVCFHPCETACNRQHFDQSLSINALERFVSDKGRDGYRAEPVFSPSGRHIAVVGSGPAGLSCAWHLARFGHSVTIYEKDDRPGGILRYGIPAYRLPKDILDLEIKDIQSLGVEIQCQTTVGKDLPFQALEKFDAVFMGVGCHKEQNLFGDRPKAVGLYGSLDFLTRAARGKIAAAPGKTVVIGGGNSAIDAARTALRSGGNVTVYYHRTRTEMPAFEEEIEDAVTEGVLFEFLAKPLDLLVEDGKVTQVRFMRTRLGDPDESGRRRPVPVDGSEFPVDADTVITAVGETLDPDLLPPELSGGRKQILIDNFGATALKKVYAGGDAALADHNIAEAIGSGKAAACAIDADFESLDIRSIKDWICIGSTDRISASRYIMAKTHTESRRVSQQVPEFNEINLAYFTRQDRIEKDKLPVQQRLAGFDEVAGAFGEAAALSEADRCFHCGVCTQCDNCLVFCPDLSVIKRLDGTGYDIDLDYCKGCGICVNECPRSAMTMEEDI